MHFRIVDLEVPIERVLKQNRDRDRQVPTDLIYHYRDRLELPNITEADRLDCFGEV